MAATSRFFGISVVDPPVVFLYNIKIKNSAMKSLKHIIVVAAAFIVFLATVGLENVFAGPVELKLKGHMTIQIPSGQSVDLNRGGSMETLNGEATRELSVDDSVSVKSGSGVEIHFSDRGVVRLSQNAMVNVDVLDPKLDAYVLNLKRGRLWINNLHTSASFNVVANGAYVIPHYAALDVNLDDQKTVIYANRHQASIGLVPLDYKAESTKRFPDDSFINSYLLAQGNQTTVFSDKIVQNEDTLRKLFYSKLVKEFPFGAMDPQLLTSEFWLRENIKLDSAYESKIKDQVSQQIRSRGLKIADLTSFGYTFGQSLNNFYNFLTLSRAKIISRINDGIFDHFDDAKYLLLFGQNTRAKERLDFFQKMTDEALNSQGDDYKAVILARFQEEYDRLSYVSPDDPLSAAKKVVNNYLLSKLGDTEEDIRHKFLLVRNVMNGVYDLAEMSSQGARSALEDYYAQFTALVQKEKNLLNRMRNIVTEENQIMDNLFRRYPIFYRDRFFAMKNELEQQWLALLPEGEDKNEEKQTIVSTKIDFLRQLQTFFLADKIAVEDAKQIVFRLFTEADELQLPPEKQVAVNELFAIRLKDFGIFYRYLNSPEYVSTTLHGSSRRTQFDEFVKKQQEQVSIQEIQREILGEEAVPSVTPAMILADAREAFADIGATDVVFGNFTDINQQTIPLNRATVEGINIRGIYAWNNKLVSQIYAGDNLISEDPVSLANLGLLIKTKTQVPVVSPEPAPQPSPAPTPAPEVSRTERVAKILLIQKLKTNDIGVTEADLTIVDLQASTFSIGKAILVSDQSVNFSFDIDGKNNVATNLVVTTASGPSTIEGPVNLADVSAQVKAAVEAGKPQS